MKAKDSARMVLKSVQSFAAQNPRYLKQINFIIYQDDMVGKFKEEVASFSKRAAFSKEKPSSLLGDALNYVKGAVQGMP